MQKLFTEFTPTTAAQWKEQLVKDLKGVDFNQLKWHTNNGFDVNPFYTNEDQIQEKAPLFSHSDWNIGTFIDVDDEKKANQVALEALNGGVSCLAFCLDGTKDLSVLLKDIQIEYITIQFLLNGNIGSFDKNLTALISERKLDPSKLDIAVNYDVLAHLAEHGNWLTGKDTDMNDVVKTANIAGNKYKLVVDGSLYQNSGANQVTELALITSHYNEYLNFLTEVKFDLSKLNKGIQINISVGSDFFAEISKLRALRNMISIVNKAYGFEAPLHLSCTTSHLTLAGKDIYTNMLRTTTQAMSAVLGGCSTLYVSKFDESLDKESSSLSIRMARNQQLILKEESYLNKASDIGAGSYYIESLTEQLGTEAFELFKAWEAQGGFISCLEKGTIQKQVNEQASFLKNKVASCEMVIIGVNKFINSKDDPGAVKTKPAMTSNQLFEPIKALHLADVAEPANTTAR